MHPLIEILKLDLRDNNGKISQSFIDIIANSSEVIYLKPTDNTRICVIKLETGHEVVGIAQVLDAKNDVPEKGKEIAFQRAKDQLWSVFGSIAKVL